MTVRCTMIGSAVIFTCGRKGYRTWRRAKESLEIGGELMSSSLSFGGANLDERKGKTDDE